MELGAKTGHDIEVTILDAGDTYSYLRHSIQAEQLYWSDSCDVCIRS